MVAVENDDHRSSPDKIIEDLGGCGKYQMRMCVVSHIMKTLVCWSIMSIIIVTKTPDFWCDEHVKPVNMTSFDDINKSTDYDAQASCTNMNGTTCTKFRFDGSVVRSMVSEFDLVSDYSFVPSTLMSIQSAGNLMATSPLFDLVCDYSFVPSTLMSIQSAGNLVGNLAIGQVADLVGRKTPFFGAVLLVTVADFVTLAANGWILVAVCKFFVGMGTGAFMTTTYSLMSEFTLARNRVWIIGFPSWPMQTCVFCLVAWLVRDWRYMTLACGIVGVPCLFAWWVIPESFRWLLAHGRQDEAEEILTRISNYNDKPHIESKRLAEIAAAQEAEKKDDRKYTLLDMFKSRYLIKVTVLMAFNWFGLGFVGYGIVFGIQELSGSIYLNLFLFNIVGIPTKFIAVWTQNKFGRRVTSIFCYGGTALACFVVALIQNVETDARDSITNGFALIANIGITMLWGPIQTMTIELYPTVIRNIGFGTLSVLGRLGAIISPQFMLLGKYTGIPGFLYFACGIVATVCFLTLFGVPETKDAYLSDKIEETKHEMVVEAAMKTEESKHENGLSSNNAITNIEKVPHVNTKL